MRRLLRLREPWPGRGWPYARVLFGAGLVCTLAGLLAHAWLVRFLTDDAYIAFRYARNLSEGHGLVFNPGERVEGYANFAWLLLLAGLHRAGVAPEVGAHALSLAATAVLWLLVVRFAWRELAVPGGAHHHAWVLVAPALLALTRSVAAWSTSGMETRLFEVLAFAGVVRLLAEVRALRAGEGAPLPWGALLLGAAALTRPEGILVAVAAALPLIPRVRGVFARGGRRWLGVSALTWGAIVCAHFAFRLLYYGEWLPNVYYAKIDGSTRFDLGADYVACFALEHAAYLWLPLLAAGALLFVRRGRAEVPLAFGSVCALHALYVASIGGDHFEYRPLDLLFPFAFLLVAAGALHLARGVRSTVAVGLLLAAVAWGVVELPRQVAAQFPARFTPGFPGLAAERGEASSFLDPSRSPLYRLPLLRRAAETHRSLLNSITAHFAGNRREEHVLFLAEVLEEGERVRRLLAGGVLPRDTYIALNCVGAIPYLTRLRTLDRLGLNDAEVARMPFVTPYLAHGKHASLEIAVERGVDLWSVHPYLLHWRDGDPELHRLLRAFHAAGQEVWFGRVDEEHYVLVWLPLGIEHARRRFPRLHLESTLDAEAVAAAGG